MEPTHKNLNTLLNRHKSVSKMAEKSFLDLKYSILQQHKYELELMTSYYSQENKNPTFLVSQTLSILTSDENKLVVTLLSDINKDRRLYNERAVNLLNRNNKFTASWATPAFKKAWRKIMHPSRNRHLRLFREDNSLFLNDTGIDRRVLIDFLYDNFFFEMNLICWVKKI